jgi:predicted transposase YbfD/YdcC
MPSHGQQKTFEVAAATHHDLRVQVKGNQPTLLHAVQALAQQTPPCGQSYEVDLTRRRHTTRTVRVFAAAGLPEPWTEHIPAVVEVQRVTDTFSTKTAHWKLSRETRYYVCSRTASAEVLAHAIRGHWGIENQGHYVKDVTLREDASRIRPNPGIFARLRSFALNLLRHNGETNISLALYDNALDLDRVLQYQGVLR